MRSPRRLVPALALAAISVAPTFAHAEDAVASARAVIRRAIEAHGQDALRARSVRFKFRDVPFRMTRKGGQFQYERWSKTRRGEVHEVIHNDGFTARLGGQALTLPDRMRANRQESLNSVIYFASLPLVLEDPAVRPRALASAKIKGQSYDAIEVRFVAQDGGVDHEDVFRYWFEPATGRLRFLAYQFHTGQGGVRFRVADGFPTAEGITFINWENYGLEDKNVPLDTLPDLWAKGALPHLSTIHTDDISIDADRP